MTRSGCRKGLYISRRPDNPYQTVTMMKDKIERIKLACALGLLGMGMGLGILMLLVKDGPAQNHYLYISSYMDQAVLIPTYLSIYAGVCIFSGAFLLSKINYRG